MDRLIVEVPQRLLRGESTQPFLREQGRERGIIRPHQRVDSWFPEIEEHEIVWPPASIGEQLRRQPRYAHNPGGHARRKPPTLS